MLPRVFTTIKNLKGGTTPLWYYTTSNSFGYSLPFGTNEVPWDCNNAYLMSCSWMSLLLASILCWLPISSYNGAILLDLSTVWTISSLSISISAIGPLLLSMGCKQIDLQSPSNPIASFAHLVIPSQACEILMSLSCCKIGCLFPLSWAIFWFLILI